MDHEIEQLRSAAMSLLEKARGSTVPELASAVEKVTGVMKLCSDCETTATETRKLALEESKIQRDIATASREERSERFKEYVSLLAPIVTIITLAATLAWQSWQFVQSEKSKKQAAEDTQWEETVKVISQTGKVSPGVIALSPFLKSSRYGDAARNTAISLLAQTTDNVFFNDLFSAAFVPVGWDNINYVVKLDRALANKTYPVWDKVYNKTTGADEVDKLSPEERTAYYFLADVLPKVCGQIGSVLRQPRPSGATLDLSATLFYDCDLRGVDLSNANIEGIGLRWVDLTDANLDHIAQFQGAYFYHVVWWEARRMNQDLLTYLHENSKYDSNFLYGPRMKQVPPQQYVDAFNRLQHQVQ